MYIKHLTTIKELKNGIQKTNSTERDGSVVTHETRIQEVPGSIPVAGQPGCGFSGFLNLKIAKELVIFHY